AFQILFPTRRISGRYPYSVSLVPLGHSMGRSLRSPPTPKTQSPRVSWSPEEEGRNS
ncbi:unnamed protein product, partial [Musa acuminata subsp. burmannicoides]